jgi:hypothetical protein
MAERAVVHKKVGMGEYTPESAEMDACDLLHQKFKAITMTPQ